MINNWLLCDGGEQWVPTECLCKPENPKVCLLSLRLNETRAPPAKAVERWPGALPSASSHQLGFIWGGILGYLRVSREPGGQYLKN